MMLMVEGKIIGWDLDYTLGNFYPIATNRRGLTATYDIALAHQCLRSGISELLERLCKRNCRNFILTQSSTAYALEVLASTGLSKYFEGIFDGQQIDVGRGKLIRPLLRSLHLTDEEAQSQVLITGDTRDDQPADISGVVFVLHPGGFSQDATVLETISNRLDQIGEGSFNRGFSGLYSRAQSLRDLPPSLRYYPIHNSIKLLMDQQTTLYSSEIKGHRGATTVPVLWALNRS